jgi:hypothetical protein
LRLFVFSFFHPKSCSLQIHDGIVRGIVRLRKKESVLQTTAAATATRHGHFAAAGGFLARTAPNGSNSASLASSKRKACDCVRECAPAPPPPAVAAAPPPAAEEAARERGPLMDDSEGEPVANEGEATAAGAATATAAAAVTSATSDAKPEAEEAAVGVNTGTAGGSTKGEETTLSSKCVGTRSAAAATTAVVEEASTPVLGLAALVDSGSGAAAVGDAK